MKKLSVKFASLMLCITLLFPLSTPISANQIGSVIGNTVYTDIIASINDYNIPSFNINGYTAVVAEDLSNYGFDVNWVPERRELYITRNTSNIVPSTYIAPRISPAKIGKYAQNVLYTDIKTYINGNQVVSYNIGGNTIVYFNDLAVFGEVSYNDYIRRLDLDISDGLNYKISPPYADLKYNEPGLYFKQDSAGGLQIRWFAISNTNKTINYYTTKYFMLNPVGDPAYDSIYGDNFFTIRTVGPVYNGDMMLDFTDEYETVAYAPLTEYIYLQSIFLEYSDGTSEIIYYDHAGLRDNDAL